MDEKTVYEYRLAQLELKVIKDKDEMKAEFNELRKEVRDVAKFQTKQIGAVAIIGFAITILVEWLKK